MKTLIVYSSLTGNTKKIAQAIAKNLEDGELISADQFQPSMIHNFDFFLIGYWVNQGDCDNKTLEILEHLKGKRIALFGTLGAKKQTEYYDMIKHRVEKHVKDTHFLGHFLCQGSVSEKTIEHYRELLKKHPEDIHMKAQVEAYEEGIHHPDETDIKDAVSFVKVLIG